VWRCTIDAETIAKALGGRRTGTGWSARCPTHDDRSPSLSLSNAGGKVLVHCHAGCSQGSVITVLKQRGLWPNSIRTATDLRLTDTQDTFSNSNNNALRRQSLALKIWNDAIPVPGTLVQVYLQSRGITLLPDSLRFHPNLPHPTGSKWPCMVAGVKDSVTHEVTAVHRTFLDVGGKGKAPIRPERMMLGKCSGNAVQLAQACGSLLVAEGVETVLSGMQACKLAGWAALSATGLINLILPDTVLKVIILADADPTGEAAAKACASRWSHEGRQVLIARPSSGKDFNDLLRAPKLVASL
jgi:putative DNA primase/helicase